VDCLPFEPARGIGEGLFNWTIRQELAVAAITTYHEKWGKKRR
jgi:hypothetical protein